LSPPLLFFSACLFDRCICGSPGAGPAYQTAMKDFLRQQLERYAERLNELNFLLSREDIMANMPQFLKLSREHTDVAAVAERYARYQQVESDSEGAKEMRADPDMADMAREEISNGEAELQQLAAQLPRMLLPRDPDAARPAFVE